MWTDHDRLASKLSPNNLKVETRSTEPADVDRSGKLYQESQKIISLVFDVFICMLLLAVLDRTESKICGISLVKHDESINSDNVVSSLYLCDSQGARRSSIMTINDNDPNREPCDMLPFNNFQEETWWLTLTRCWWHDRYDPNHCKRPFCMLSDFSVVRRQSSLCTAQLVLTVLQTPVSCWKDNYVFQHSSHHCHLHRSLQTRLL